MPFTVRDVVFGAGVPYVVTLVTAYIVLATSNSKRWHGIACAAAVSMGYVAGYWSLALGPIVPEFDREWLPYAAVFGWLPSLVASQQRKRTAAAALLLASIGFAWLLVPNWSSLQPSRAAHVAVGSLYTFVVCLAMFRVAGRVAEAGDSRARVSDCSNLSRHVAFVWLAAMVITLAIASGMLALSGSLRFGQTTGSAMAAIAGLATSMVVAGKTPPLAGVAWIYTFVISAAMLTGKVNSFSSIPTFCYVLMPAAPLSFGLFDAHGDAMGVRRSLIVSAAVALFVCVAAMGIALIAEFGGSESLNGVTP